MSWEPPSPADTWKAIDLFLAQAYQTSAPLAVRKRLEQLRAASATADFYRVAAFEASPAEAPTRYALRLGNRFYPHMKLIIERSPDGFGSLFSADTHDRHVQPAAGSPEAAAFADLSRNNQEVAMQIEAAFEEHAIPTFKRFLRQDLARRRADLAEFGAR